ncbi:PEP/pyruvate-binding domain-containing protein [Micromonospora aurantiaca]|uniref:PEP/pyruvate-binding domain-containing protein n=1 Tax=Micromonospora aurantiaca (nom. illeg.) TaxID=47850 RepID=UPI003430A1AB
MTGRWIVPAEELPDAPVALVGGKAAGLGILFAASIPVPSGFCITTAALTAAGAVEDEILAALARQRKAGVARFAVRSSHPGEDTADAGAPGIYHSEVGASTDSEVLAAVRRVWYSAADPTAAEYRRRRGIHGDGRPIAVLVQHAPEAVAGGVIYTMLPHDDDPSAVLIEYSAGPPSNVTDNVVMPHRCVVSKRRPEAVRLDSAVLAPDQARTLVSWALAAERSVDAPLNLEWLLDRDGQLWMLQARRLLYPATGPTPPYTALAAGTSLHSEKLIPFRLANADVPTIEAHLILPSAFQAAGTTAVREACAEVFRHYVATGAVSIRSAYWSARESGDMLSQSPQLRSVEDCLAYLESYWRSVLAGGRVDYSTEVALLVSNWMLPRASVIATAPGCGQPIVLAAIYGLMDGLETCSHDVFVVDADSFEVRDARTPVKPFAVLAGHSRPQALPAELRNRPVLASYEIHMAAGVAAAVAAAVGPARVELLFGAREAPTGRPIVTWQITLLAPDADMNYYAVVEGGDQRAVAEGHFAPLYRPDDVERLPTADNPQIVAINFERFKLRDPRLGAELAAKLRDTGLPVALKGSVLSHFAALLREYGVTVFPVNELPALSAGTPVCLTPV